MPAITPTADGVVIDVRVIPRASKPGLAGTRDQAVLVRIGAAPVDGAANAELVETLATAFGVPRRMVRLVSGERGRLKRVSIAGLSEAEAIARIMRA